MTNHIGRSILALILVTTGFLFVPPCCADDKGGYFPILPWELPPKRAQHFDEPGHGLPSIAECGFTTAAFVLPRQLDECHKLGLRALVRMDPHLVKWPDLSDQQILDRVREMVAGTQNDPTVLGYFLADEPGAPEFPALAKAVAAVKKLAPG
ncbi:MAG TPA: hypothetical protein VG722_12360, partial [Tepidisphaeraceae bacterium]|nr:hypothetical protein [Tepidisphaeraceae bacterium]